MNEDAREAGAPDGHPRRTPFEFIANCTYDWESWVDASGRLVWVNPAVERLTGHTVAECLAMEDYPLPMVDAEDRGRIAGWLAEAAAGRPGNDVEFRILHKDGSRRWGAVSWQALCDDHGRSLGYRSSVRDITQRKQVEAALREACDEASRANLAKSRFLAAASHDLRQPLQAAALFLATLRRRLEDPRLRGLADSVATCLDSGNSLLDALLDLSRLDAGATRVEVEDFDLGALVERLGETFRPAAAEADVELHLRVGRQAVRSDPLLVARVLENLIANALRHATGGRVLVCARRRAGRWRVEVRDNGCGIPAEEHQRVFEEFHQLGNPERDRQKGLGLGLAIVARIAAMLEAPLDLRSALGRGATFAIELPAAAAPPAPRHADDAAQLTALRGRIVAALDDEPQQLRALGGWLEALECRVVGADTAAALIARLRELGLVPDVVIADQRLRGAATGVEAVAALRKALAHDIPALLLTGDTEPDWLAEAAANGLRVLHKPVTPEALLSALSVCLAR